MPPINLDYNASIDPAVVSAMPVPERRLRIDKDGAPDMLFVGGEIPFSSVAQLVGFRGLTDTLSATLLRAVRTLISLALIGWI